MSSSLTNLGQEGLRRVAGSREALDATVRTAPRAQKGARGLRSGRPRPSSAMVARVRLAGPRSAFARGGSGIWDSRFHAGPRGGFPVLLRRPGEGREGSSGVLLACPLHALQRPRPPIGRPEAAFGRRQETREGRQPPPRATFPPGAGEKLRGPADALWTRYRYGRSLVARPDGFKGVSVSSRRNPPYGLTVTREVTQGAGGRP